MACTCEGRIVRKYHESWWLECYGVGVTLTLRVHTGTCPLSDEVICATAEMHR